MNISPNPLVILADDDRHFVAIMGHYLRRWGFRVRESATAERLLSLIEEEPPRVLLLDVRYGADDGLVVLETILRRWPDLQVVVLTAHGTIRNAVLAIQCGACEYLTKPVDLEPMRLLLERLVGGSAGSRRFEVGEPAVGMPASQDDVAVQADARQAQKEKVTVRERMLVPRDQAECAPGVDVGDSRTAALLTAELQSSAYLSNFATLSREVIAELGSDDSHAFSCLAWESDAGLEPLFTAHGVGRIDTAERKPRPDWVGRQLGHHEIVRILGRGGIGVVFEAEDTLLNRRVAIKLLADSTRRSVHATNAILREARLAARLNHPNVIAIFEIGQEAEQFFLVMELAPGGSLAQSVGALGALGWREATTAIADACLGLEAAHALGLVHLDLKPANLLRGEDGRIKLTDFGLARWCDPAPRSEAPCDKVSGTAHFMSPEQCRGGLLDHRSDLYALGATYYTLLTGRPPYWGAVTCGEIVAQHCMAPIPDPREVMPEIPAACVEIITRSMAKSPVERFASAAELRAAALYALEAGRGRARAG